ncbi:MAG: IS4 family transposase [Anaerolineae bacterium]|nr:IS4 family transposase [Anaerolineae bacterium]
MYAGKLVFTQVLEHLPQRTFQQLVHRYQGDRYVKRFTCQDQFRCMAFAQLTHRESLRDIETCLRAQEHKLYHMGIRGGVSRSTLAEANEARDWRLYADFAQRLIHKARKLYADEDLGLELDNTVYALDATTIDLCLSLFPWAPFQPTKAAVKLHTLMDLRGSIPSFIHVSDGKLHDVNVLDLLVTEPGAFYVMDRGYLDYARLSGLHQAGAFFVIRAKSNLQYRRQYSRPVNKSTGLRSDQTVVLTGAKTATRYPDKLRRVTVRDTERGRTLVLLTNHFGLPAATIAELYRSRWQIELFFKWIKQNLRIKRFFGTSENAVKTQIWIAVSVYILIAILKKQLGLKASLYTLLQVLSVNIFERAPLNQLLAEAETVAESEGLPNQLSLFEKFPGQ